MVSLKFCFNLFLAIHSGELSKVEYETYEKFGLKIPKTCPGVPPEILHVIYLKMNNDVAKEKLDGHE